MSSPIHVWLFARLIQKRKLLLASVRALFEVAPNPFKFAGLAYCHVAATIDRHEVVTEICYRDGGLKMASFVVLKFPAADGAENAFGALAQLTKQHLIEIADAAIVTWPEGKKKPTTRQAYNLTAAGALNGGFWGMLFGMIFFVPLLGAAIGAAMGALSGSMTDIGINDEFISDCREKITPGTSALFLLADTSAADKVIDVLKTYEPEVITTNLSKEQESKLREAFEEEA